MIASEALAGKSREHMKLSKYFTERFGTCTAVFANLLISGQF
ncbi:hypothetical protein EV696_104162 [Permianibacter aggregans]|uniref:Uncharacterized protein n=1 Tax=Permianibacter aggregans TaxID=1510150 RepID=A0A4V3D7W6_9GAMM|nr:hypothetical protein EV696_104162 [Permianibacter aggregans]